MTMCMRKGTLSRKIKKEQNLLNEYVWCGVALALVVTWQPLDSIVAMLLYH